MKVSQPIQTQRDLPPQAVRDFAIIRGRVNDAIKERPRKVTLEDALKQVRAHLKDRSKK
jgi:hypothetical protein